MWEKAAEIVHSEGYITTFPGDSGGTGFSTSVPHIFVVMLNVLDMQPTGFVVIHLLLLRSMGVYQTT